MTAKDNGVSPAYSTPGAWSPGGIRYVGQTGLTKREYFAAVAMHGLCSNPEQLHPLLDLSAVSVKIADALLDALEATK